MNCHRCHGSGTVKVYNQYDELVTKPCGPCDGKGWSHCQCCYKHKEHIIALRLLLKWIGHFCWSCLQFTEVSEEMAHVYVRDDDKGAFTWNDIQLETQSPPAFPL